ncbi:hypothetical protein BDZ85DRAFT_255610 [Elsinoe ampelina]|uniref:Uncharacterized protein n=1 Tax=Elsinoe ampelina TaxID=302913 RepID=A0A6A6GR96_9PEZI|nr:hypothetical protein BDZ85DRAFT_255610 [Elsinoe ampelina]
MFLKKKTPSTSAPPSPTSTMSPEASTAVPKNDEDFKHTFEKNFNKALEAGTDPPPIFQHHDMEAYPPLPPPAPYATFNIPPLPRRSGIYIPTPIAILLVLIFLFETSVIVLYTAVALYQTLPAAGFSMGPSKCQPSGYGAINVAPNIYLASPSPAPQVDPSITPSPSTPQAVVTVTAEPPTRTHFSTVPAIPSVTTSTVFSTATPERSTVTSVEMVTRSA